MLKEIRLSAVITVDDDPDNPPVSFTLELGGLTPDGDIWTLSGLTEEHRLLVMRVLNECCWKL